MEEQIAKNLAGIWYIATAEGDQPHVRPFDQAAVVNETVYIGTANNKQAYEQMLKNPKVEIFALTQFGPYRLKAEIYPEEDQEIAREAFSKMGKPFDEKLSAAMKLKNITIL